MEAGIPSLFRGTSAQPTVRNNVRKLIPARWSRSLSGPLPQQMRRPAAPYVGHLEPNRTDFNKQMNVGPDANLKFPSGRQWNGVASQCRTQPQNVPDGDRTAISSGPSSRSHAIG
ncbi:hypothetical protein M404DRAFT_1003689 [Pisolithus tinctorius Marx 270]|uniref:Uncharacterized protein n=1 Tax=Pisolithus tinctorius Marx 270 TaxID=870435 RepID=A0A0C3NZF8_PISTI|nr:hypothetical protein M404DRAFT_1003689 [Pisolithus tinctorius Marx 270]